MEIWRKTHLSERHEVSNLGNVRTVDAYIKNPIHGKGLRKGRLRKPNIGKTGYAKITLSINGKRYYCLVHRLVAIAFIPNPELKPMVNHIDGNKSNNRVTNLEWVTREENCRHAISINLFEPSKFQQGERGFHAKLKNKQILEIREKYKRGSTVTELALEYEVTHGNISHIVNGKTWKNLL